MQLFRRACARRGMQRRLLPALQLLVTVGLVAGCGEDAPIAPPDNPLPVLLGVDPPQLVVGTSVTTITLVGNGYVQGSQARWNGADRVTRYRSAQSLSVDLLASDVATAIRGTLVVVNGAPGGGTSGTVELVVGYPAPTISAVSPTEVLVASALAPGLVRIVVTGTGFVEQSLMRLGSLYVAPTAVTPTQLTVDLARDYLAKPGVLQITVVNPSPGGGTSNAVAFTVANPKPVISAITPDSALTGASATLQIDGTGFADASIVRWNGADRPTFLETPTRLVTTIPVGDLRTSTNATVTVFNPAPGGGTSNAIDFRVRDPSPRITGLEPGSIPVGSGPTYVLINGSNFAQGAIVRLDGAFRSSMVNSGTSIGVNLVASDVAAPRLAKLTVTNADSNGTPSGTSNEATLAVVAPGLTMSVARVIALAHADVVYDTGRGVLYASVPTGANQFGSSLVRLDPTTGQVTNSVFIGGSPGQLAMSDDGQFLYVGLANAPRVVRIALSSFTTDIAFDLVAGQGVAGTAFVTDLEPIPGTPRSVAVAMSYSVASQHLASVSVYDDKTRRDSTIESNLGATRITRGPSATRLFGYNDESTHFGFYRILLTPSGPVVDDLAFGLVSGHDVDIAYDGGFVYASSGDVVDAGAFRRRGQIPATGVVRPDATNARVHFLADSTIQTFHYNALTKLGDFSDRLLAGHTRLVRWGTDGLAVGGGATIVLLRGGLVAQ